MRSRLVRRDRLRRPRVSELPAQRWVSSSSTRSAVPPSTSLGTVAAYMLGTHVLIGIGEGVITAFTVMAVARARPDLVYLLRTAPRAVVARHDRGDAASLGGSGSASPRSRCSIAGAVSYLASSSPDGLDSATLKGCEVVETDGRRSSCAATASRSTPAITRWPPRRWPTTRSTGRTARAGSRASSASSSPSPSRGGAFWLISATAGERQADQPATDGGCRSRTSALPRRRFAGAPRSGGGEDRLPGGVRPGRGRHARESCSGRSASMR